MDDYKPTIGLEIHAELKTRTKMFCDSLNESEEKHPNQNVCPVCLGHPGTLPTINKKAVEAVIKTGLALGGRINPESKFDRKNYFYPDLPKGYQISQYDQPLVSGGEFLGVRIRRIHLEEDTGTLIHNDYDNNDDRNDKSHSHRQKSSYTLVDFNRAGVPLMELVTEPDIESAEQAVEFGKELQLILRYLDVSDADMERGQMRIEVNLSLHPNDGEDALGVKVEIKNLNSFRAVEDAIKYEIKRQSNVLSKGECIAQETRGWDDARKITVSQRQKEEAHDYRYFPEPDLPPLEPMKVFDIEALKRHLPELPAQKRARFVNEYNLSSKQAEILVDSKNFADYFEESDSELKSELSILSIDHLISARQFLFNYLVSDLRGLMSKEAIEINMIKVKPESFAHLIAMIEKGELSSRMAKDILLEMFQTGLDPHEIIKEKGISQISDEEIIKKAIQEVLAENPAAVGDYKKGKGNALQFLIGKTMAKLKGQGNPEVIRKIFIEELTK